MVTSERVQGAPAGAKRYGVQRPAQWVVAIAALAVVAVAVASSLVAQERGGVDVTIREWELPQGTASFVPHDPAVAPDGGVWYTGYGANVLGRLDQATGQIKEFPLPTADSGPHGLDVDARGDIWYTGNRAGLIGRLEPASGRVTEYRMPNPAARDPHTPVFDRHGILWFTVQSGNFVGKLDPATGAITLKAVGTPGAMPHGIVIASDGVPVFAMSGSNKLGSINPQTMEITEHLLPDGARPRRLAITGDVVWYGDSARGVLGRMNRATNVVKEFPSPGGAKSAPWGVAATSDGRIWYSESGITPNTVVRFDPQSEQMQSWPIPSGGGVVRHMVAAPDGTLWLACSGVGRLGRVQPLPARR